MVGSRSHACRFVTIGKDRFAESLSDSTRPFRRHDCTDEDLRHQLHMIDRKRVMRKYKA
jgi:hypothetical protein